MSLKPFAHKAEELGLKAGRIELCATDEKRDGRCGNSFARHLPGIVGIRAVVRLVFRIQLGVSIKPGQEDNPGHGQIRPQFERRGYVHGAGRGADDHDPLRVAAIIVRVGAQPINGKGNVCPAIRPAGMGQEPVIHRHAKEAGLGHGSGNGGVLP